MSTLQAGQFVTPPPLQAGLSTLQAGSSVMLSTGKPVFFLLQSAGMETLLFDLPGRSFLELLCASLSQEHLVHDRLTYHFHCIIICVAVDMVCFLPRNSPRPPSHRSCNPPLVLWGRLLLLSSNCCQAPR